jgi:hypothetical protein
MSPAVTNLTWTKRGRSTKAGGDGALQRGSLASRACLLGYVPNGTILTKFTESRADHGLENFGDSLYPYERYGRHDWTRTSDLYRVKVGLNHTYNNFRVRPETAKPR